MIILRANLLDSYNKYVIIFVIILKIIFCQVFQTVGSTVPQLPETNNDVLSNLSTKALNNCYEHLPYFKLNGRKTKMLLQTFDELDDTLEILHRFDADFNTELLFYICAFDINISNYTELKQMILCKEQYLDESCVNITHGSFCLQWKSDFFNLLYKYEKVNDAFKICFAHKLEDLHKLGEILKISFDEAISTKSFNINVCALKKIQDKAEKYGKDVKDLKLAVISRVIQDDYENVKFETLVNFIKNRTQITDRMTAYETLKNKMREQYKVKQLEDIKVNLCILEILFGSSENAVQYFNELKSVSISEIIKEVYNYCNDEMKNFDNILKFIEKLATQSMKDSAYTALHQEVLDHYTIKKQDTTLIILCFLEIILRKNEEALEHFKDLQPSSISELSEYAVNFHSFEFSRFIDYIRKKPKISDVEYKIIIIASEILYKKYDKGVLELIVHMLFQVVEKPSSIQIDLIYLKKLQNLWSHFIVDLCKVTDKNPVTFLKHKDFSSYNKYDNESFKRMKNYIEDVIIPSIPIVLRGQNIINNFDGILKCVSRLDSIEYGGIIYSIIFDELTAQKLVNSQNLMTQFAYYIKNYMDMPKYSLIDEKYKQIFEKLKRRIPEWVQKLIWNGNKCKLKNRKWDQYLYVGGELGCRTSSKNHMVLSKPINISQGTVEAQSLWEFTAINQGSAFMIKNVDLDEYLNPDYNADTCDRSVFTWKIDSSNYVGIWNIKASSNENYITLQNIEYDEEYLYVGNQYEHNSLWRRVLTSRFETPMQRIPPESEWELICV